MKKPEAISGAHRQHRPLLNKMVAGDKVLGQLKAIGQMRMSEVPGSEFELPADLVLLAMGCVSPVASMLADFGV